MIAMIKPRFVLTLLPALPSVAIELDEATRTVRSDVKGTQVTLTPEQVKRGKRLFNSSCGICHVGGLTKTNPNVGLDPEALSLATPPRDNVESLVNYMKNPDRKNTILNSSHTG